jgi:hypothetical protein
MTCIWIGPFFITPQIDSSDFVAMVSSLIPSLKVSSTQIKKHAIFFRLSTLILQHCGFAVYNACLLKIHVLMLETISIRMLSFSF